MTKKEIRLQQLCRTITYNPVGFNVDDEVDE